jgi:hypothetical protein
MAAKSEESRFGRRVYAEGPSGGEADRLIGEIAGHIEQLVEV